MLQLLVVTFALAAPVVGRAPLTFGERVTVHSDLLDEDVAMDVYVPESFAVSSPEHTWPVVLVHGAHGAEFFHLVAGVVRHLGDRERMPEAIVVSLPDVDGLPEVYTHGMWPARRIPGSPGDPRLAVRHVEEEVLPFLEQTYRANRYRILIGVSGSSLFPLYLAAEAPDLLDGLVLVAAADTLGMGLRRRRTFVDDLDAALPARSGRALRIYVGAAAADLEGRDDYRENLDALSRLAAHPGVEIEVEVFDDEDHYAVLVPALRAALDQHFPWAQWSARYRDLAAQPGDALDNVDRYYAALSERAGFTVLPRADRWNSVNCLRFLARHLIGEGRTAEAVRVAERRAAYRPGAPESFTGLADAYEAAERPADAVAPLRRAIELVRASGGDPAPIEARLAGLEADAKRR